VGHEEIEPFEVEAIHRLLTRPRGA